MRPPSRAEVDCKPPSREERERWHARRRLFRRGHISLQRRIFLWFGATILVTGVVVFLVVRSTAPDRHNWHEQLDAARRFAVASLARSWYDPGAREELASTLSTELGIGVVLEDAHHEQIAAYGPVCEAPWRSEVRHRHFVMGYVGFCPSRVDRARGAISFALAIFAAFVALWASSGLIARRLGRPFGELVQVARDIGGGKLQTRMTISRRHSGEALELAEAINDMAGRIEKQLLDQRELLAAVSHEVRSPLARMRLLLELLRESGSREELVASLEREVVEVDALVDQLLANSRLEFTATEKRPVRAAIAAKEALERAGLDASLLVDRSADAMLEADLTLLARALGNLLGNAATHGGGATSLIVEATERDVSFTVEDRGPGFSREDLERAFESFYRGKAHGSRGTLGLGLALVKRIAIAHGGAAHAENREDGGARVTLTLPRS